MVGNAPCAAQTNGAWSITPLSLEMKVPSLEEDGFAPLRQVLAWLEEEMRGAEGQHPLPASHLYVGT